jgi:hypothetical protein
VRGNEKSALFYVIPVNTGNQQYVNTGNQQYVNTGNQQYVNTGNQ